MAKAMGKGLLVVIKMTERRIIVTKVTRGIRSCLTSSDVSHSLTGYYKGLLRVFFEGGKRGGRVLISSDAAGLCVFISLRLQCREIAC